MTRIADFVGHQLRWVRPDWRQRYYELSDGDERVATLAFRSWFGSLARAEASEGCWTFKRVGFLQTRTSIRKCDTEGDIAGFANKSWKAGGTLELPDGRRYRVSTNFWMTAFDFSTDAGAPLIKYRRIGGVLHLSAEVEILPDAAQLEELPWMVALGWYVALQLHLDSQSVGVGGGGGG